MATWLRDWAIAVVGICAIVVGLYLASLSTSGNSATSEPSTASTAAQNPPAPSAQPPQHDAAPPPAAAVSAPASTPAPSAQAPAAPAHDHMAPAMAPTMASAPSAMPAAAPAPPAPAPAPRQMTAATGANAPAAPASNALPIPGGDPASGRLVFRKCQVCHSLEAGKNILGPSLAGIVGRKSGAEPGYSYSQAMQQANLVWDAKTLDAYLTDPQKVVPGNKMPFPGLKTNQDRADIIDFLATAGNPQAAAKPAAPAAPPATAGQANQANAPSQATALPEGTYLPDAKYTLKSGIADGRMVYIGVGGEIDGKVNPVLTASEGQVVELTLINGEGAEHDITFPDQNARSPRVTGKGASTTIAFRADKAGDYAYYCSVPGHQLAGMQGQFVVTPRAPAQVVVEADISREATDLPPPLPRREPQQVRVDLVAAEVEGRLAQGTTFGYWTFNDKVPGPFIRVRVGDTVDIHLKNSADSAMMHSVDFHATTGPGGGAAVLQVEPGKEKSMTWKALVPGLYVYHCATPMVSEHIANGMYGLILVEPEGGLPPVDKEFYIMQGEVYTDIPYGQRGSAEFSVEKLLDEHPEYFVFNGSVGALSKLHPLHAKVGDNVRIFFGVGGPNFTSSFHVIGAIFDKVYMLGGVESPPLDGIQTVSVAPGGAVIVEFKPKVPGSYTIVDHALARLERGLSGVLTVEGPPNPDIYNGQTMPGMGH